MYLKRFEIAGFKSFGKKSEFEFNAPITAIVGPNGSGKSNVAEAFRFVLGEQSIKSMRGKKGEDLIFNGAGARANRAGVKVTFDNTGRLLDVDFDEVTIERAVYRDGTNEYQINGSKVRLKDITELLAGANIGASGHHIISQGEADRVLSATPKERRAMIEDALGLRVYQYKKNESEKKLKKTEENRQQIESLKKENAPHLKFLERQVNKIQKSLELRDKLTGVYQEYLKREELYLQTEQETLSGLREEPEAKLKQINSRIEELRGVLEQNEAEDSRKHTILELERERSEARNEASKLSRELGSIEGQIAFEKRRVEEELKRQSSEESKMVPFREIRSIGSEYEQVAASVEGSQDIGQLLGAVKQMKELLQEFIDHHKPQQTEQAKLDESHIRELQKQLDTLGDQLGAVHKREQEIDEKLKVLQQEIEKEKDANRESERELFSLMQQQNDLRSELGKLTSREERLARDQEDFKRELGEAGALMGREVTNYKNYEIQSGDHVVSLEEMLHEDRSVQEERRRELERMKIRLEEMGGANADEIMKEYEEVKERDAFLEKELEDLQKSAEALQQLIKDLDAELEQKFNEGITKISTAFGKFFTLMFGGGSGTLDVVREKKKRKLTDLLGLGGGDEPEEDDDEEGEEEGDIGIEVNVSLPNKRVKGLMMLSGGERALTSIALIFAMSQINPPPFLILDETDAALDEANSRRYGDMVENLAKKSQLIVITHNRETMSRAGVLYGVTMGADGVSKLLSVKFEDGLQFAK